MPDLISRPLHVFLCHSSSDKSTVRELCQRLNAESWIDIWMDEEKLLPGQDWNYEIQKALDNSDAVIVVLSNNSVSKEGYVQKELRFVLDIALEKPEGTIFALPIRLDDCRRPRGLQSIQGIDYFPPKHRDWAYARLKLSLELRANSLGIISKGHDAVSDKSQGFENQSKEVHLRDDEFILTQLGLRDQQGDWIGQIDNISSDEIISFYPLPWLSAGGKQVLALALGEALSLGHSWLGVEFLLMGLSRRPGTILRKILLEIDVDPKKFRSLLRGAVGEVERRPWEHQDLITHGEQALPFVEVIDPDTVRRRYGAGEEQLLVITPRLLAILKETAKVAGEGEVDEEYLFFMSLLHPFSLGMMLLYRRAMDAANWSPQKVKEYSEKWIAQSPAYDRIHEHITRSTSDFPIHPPYIEIMSGPLDGHIVALSHELFWTQTGKGALSFPWDMNLGTPQARFFFDEGDWWIESYPNSRETICVNRIKPIIGKMKFEKRDIIRASHTWLMVNQEG